MPFWDHLFKADRSIEYKSSSEAASIVQAGRLALAQEGDPRPDAFVGALLGLLWSEDIRSRFVAYTALTMSNAKFFGETISLQNGTPAEPNKRSETFMMMEEFTGYLHDQTPELPAAPEARYAAVAAALRTSLHTNMREMEESDEPFPVAHLFSAVHMAHTLRASEVEDRCCELLMVTDKRLIKERYGNRSERLQQLMEDLCAYFLALSPAAIPTLWTLFEAESTSPKFWRIVNRMHDRRAVPYLLDALATLSSQDAQSNIITALGNIKDMRAVPALQEIAAAPMNLLAPQATRALREILRASRDDAAQLLRPTDARHAGNAGETLLRPAAATDATLHPEELLRPGDRSPLEKREGS